MANPIQFFNEEIDFKLSHKSAVRKWITHIISVEGQSIDELNIIFCSDDYLLNINQQYLDHDYFTDIITFDNREETGHPISSDIFISIDRVRDNANNLSLPFTSELHRVIIHGVLHLLGQGDKTKDQKAEMSKREEASLSLLSIPKE